jgi:hypothetical protein
MGSFLGVADLAYDCTPVSAVVNRQAKNFFAAAVSVLSGKEKLVGKARKVFE